jgi:hypothetical protein
VQTAGMVYLTYFPKISLERPRNVTGRKAKLSQIKEAHTVCDMLLLELRMHVKCHLSSQEHTGNVIS